MDNLPRLAFYLSGVFIISAAFTLFTNEFIIKIADPGFTGTIFLIGFGLVYMNLTFAVSRRFMRRLDGPSNIPFLFSLLVAISPITWSFIYDSGLFGSIKTLYLITIFLACGFGGFLGKRAGLKAQKIFKEQLYEYLKKSGQLPEELKRLHDNLSKN